MEEKFNCSYTDVVPLHKLVPHPDNPNTHPNDQIDLLSEIIKYQGQRSPIVVSKLSGFIVRGHARLRAIKKLGWDNCAVDYQDYKNKAQEYSDLIADNKIAELSNLSKKKIIGIIKKLPANFELKHLAIPKPKEFTSKIKYGNADDEPEIPIKPVTNPGDIYSLGKHKIICGSSLDLKVLNKLLGEERIDLVVTDPPYNVDYQSKSTGMKIMNDKMDQNGFYDFLYDFYSSTYAFCKDNASMYVFHADSEGHNFRNALINSGFNLLQNLVWVKNSLVLGRQDYHWKHEPCLFAWKKGDRDKPYFYGCESDCSVLYFDKPKSSKIHPTMKPVKLLEYVIKNSSLKEQIIYDGFTGSGSTMVSCELTGRIFRGCELDPKYVDAIVNRYCKLVKTTNIIKNGKLIKWKISI